MKKTAKVLFVSALLILQLFSLSGCFDYSDVESEMFVTGLGIDCTEGGECKYLISVEIASFTNTRDSSVKSKVISAEGDSLMESFQSLIAKSSKMLYFGHCQTIVIGENVAKQGITNVLDFVFRYEFLRLSMFVIVAKDCKALDILSSKSDGNTIISYEIADTMKASENEIGIAKGTSVFELLNQINNISKCGVTPVFVKDENNKKNENDKKGDNDENKENNEKGENDEGNTHSLNGIAIFVKDRLKGYLGKNQSVFCLLASDGMKKGVLTCYIPSHHQMMSVRILRSSTDISFDVSDGHPEITLKIKTTVTLLEIPPEISLKKPEYNVIIQKDISDFISENVYILVRDTIERYGADIFGLSDEIHKKNTDYWEENQADWDEIIKSIKIKTVCDIAIEGSGITNDKIYEG